MNGKVTRGDLKPVGNWPSPKLANQQISRNDFECWLIEAGSILRRDHISVIEVENLAAWSADYTYYK